MAVVYLAAGVFLFLSLMSYYPLDPSWNTVTSAVRPVNLTGRVGSYLSDFFLQFLGLAAYAIPALILAIGWKWVQSSPIQTPVIRVAGGLLFILATAGAFGLAPQWKPIAGVIPASGILGMLIADFLLDSMNLTGAILTTAAAWIVSLYLVSSFEMAHLLRWLAPPIAWIQKTVGSIAAAVRGWRARQLERAKTKAATRAQARAAKQAKKQEQAPAAVETADAPFAAPAIPTEEPALTLDPPIVETRPSPAKRGKFEVPKFDEEDIPIRMLELPQPPPVDSRPPWEEPEPASTATASKRQRTFYKIPPMELLQEPPERSAFDSAELKETAAQIKSKFEEFNVLGSVVQINPGPVVTTFEFKPEAGVKYSRITTLTEDLCLGLQAESILIERIPGKPTVGIEVPNTRREVISLRQILESDEFQNSSSPLTVALGKDINGRIKVATLDTMPHLLIAGSTGAGKSVMLNSLIMSILYKSTPDQVRMIMVDPKRLEFGPYEGIPHLLTPVITDSKKATNALRNAVLEMERRLKLLASQGVRNIDQYNKKVKQLANKPRNLFEEEDPNEEILDPLPYVVIIIDELADLMMLERANVEESVTRLAQMARAVGMHLVLATQRPSVDVITGLIKANFPSRISFRVATRVDSRTVLDVMGAEHLLGKGDMLFLPPGSSRLVRVHGSYVSEAETNRVVENWKAQAEPEYDKTFLIAPPSDDEEAEPEDLDGPEDPMYQEAVRVVCDMGKASTSTLQRRLRLGYGRAARILDMMQRDGIIGPPDGSRPRDVLKRPDWLSEVESSLR